MKNGKVKTGNAGITAADLGDRIDDVIDKFCQRTRWIDTLGRDQAAMAFQKSLSAMMDTVEWLERLSKRVKRLDRDNRPDGKEAKKCKATLLAELIRLDHNTSTLERLNSAACEIAIEIDDFNLDLEIASFRKVDRALKLLEREETKSPDVEDS
jgi:hypothetical protein